MRKIAIVGTVALLSTSLAGCSVNQVQSAVKALCQFDVNAKTVIGLAGTLYPPVGTAQQIIEIICANKPTSGRSIPIVKSPVTGKPVAILPAK